MSSDINRISELAGLGKGTMAEAIPTPGANPILDIATRASQDQGMLDGYIRNLYDYVDRNNMENDPKWKQAEQMASDYHFDWSKKNGYPSANANPELARKGEKLRHRALVNAVVKVFGQQGLAEDLQADDGEHYRSFDDFISRFDPDSFDDVEEHSAGQEIRGYINGRNVMSWQYDDESMTSGWGNYDMTMLEDDELQRRIGINSVNKFARPGQTDLRNIPAGNHPRSRNKYSDEYRSSQPERLKHSIRASLGKHAEPNLPESMASMLKRLDELSEGTGYMINGKTVDPRSIVIAGGSFNDSSDTYAKSAEFTDGTPLNDAELDMLSDDGDLMSKLHLKENASSSGIQAKYPKAYQ
jgi:hypothetical protein